MFTAKQTRSATRSRPSTTQTSRSTQHFTKSGMQGVGRSTSNIPRYGSRNPYGRRFTRGSFGPDYSYMSTDGRPWPSVRRGMNPPRKFSKGSVRIKSVVIPSGFRVGKSGAYRK